MASNQYSAEEKAAFERFKDAGESGDGRAELARFFNLLVKSEEQARFLVSVPNISEADLPEGGSLEFAAILYWLENPPPGLSAELADDPKSADMFALLKSYAPPSQLTAEQYAAFLGWVGSDGTIYGTEKYEQLDWHWYYAARNYVENLVNKDIVKPFPRAAIEPAVLTPRDGGTDDPVIAIVGDWGTGYFKEKDGSDCGAQLVMADIQQKNPDCLIHLGDVYYAGTNKRDPAGEEQDNFVDIWPDMGEGRSFTLNSNHEMYGRASGYFDVALESSGAFAHQKGLSYFGLKYGDWLLLGLDSAYYSDQENGHYMYMKGAIGTTVDREQISEIEAVCAGHEGPIMVLTHHDPCDTNSAITNILFRQMSAAIGRAPTAWYWGHVHNGIVYNQLFTPQHTGGLLTKGRCCGHGAVPFGNASGLAQNGNIAYYAHTAEAPALHPRVKNGYALVTLRKDGGFDEAFYETGNDMPVYQRSWGPTQLGF